MKNYPIQVQQIHDAFNSAGETLLAQAQKIVNQTPENLADKVQRLQKVGFKNSIDVQRYEQVRMTIEQANLIQYYQQNYPDNKFITEDQVRQICSKYKLECAPIERYKGFVPDEKLKQIEKFFVLQKDRAVDEIIITNAWDTGTAVHFIIRGLGARFIHNQLGLKTIPVNHPALTFHRGRPFSVDIDSDSGNRNYIEKYRMIQRTERLICAPKKDFDLKGLKKIGALFMSVTTVHVPDPVVLQPVKGGFLILCAWGDESADELVVNPKHN